MAVQKRKFLHKAKSVALALGITALAVFGSCKKPEPEDIRCYGYDNKTLKVHDGKEEKSVPFSRLGLSEKKPLDYYCTRSGHLFWLTPKKVHVRRITNDNGDYSSREVVSSAYTKPDEYSDPDVKVISGHIGGDPTKNWQEIRIATLTNTGIFQVFTLDLDSIAKDKPNRAIVYFMEDTDIEPSERWPEKNIAGAVVRVLNKSEFSIIPLGTKDLGSVRTFFYLKIEGDLRKGDSWVGTMKLLERNPTLKNVFSVTTRYEEASGGHIGNFHCETTDKKTLVLLQILTNYKN